MGKTIVETGHKNYEPPVGVKKGCGRCPSGCRTKCSRGKMINYDIIDGEMDDFELAPIRTDYGSFRKR